MSDDDKVVNFRDAVPSARMKQFDDGDRRRHCPHRAIVVWRKEPIIECDDCGAVVDPYYWIRERVSDWQSALDSLAFKKRQAEGEIAELRKTLKVLRDEFADAADKQRAKTALMILPPRRRI